MPEVLFILGAGRSGSTIFERLLATHDNTLPVGELCFIWRSFEANHLCSCGKVFLECEFWGKVRHRAFRDGVPDDAEVARLLAVDRQRFIPAMHHPLLRSTAFARNLAEAQPLLKQLYQSIAQEGNGRLIVDSTKDPSYAHLLATIEGLRVAYIHLVRDPRAVAWSRRRVKHRPEIHWEEAHMDRWPLRRTALEWNTKASLGIWLAARRPEQVMRLRYEDLVGHPDAALQRVDQLLRSNGMATLGTRMPHPDPDRYHTVAGNPLRFDPLRPITFRLDGEWTRVMPLADRAIVTALCAPLLAWHRRG